MRVLFGTQPAETLFHFMVPLAWALRSAGHEVVVASQPEFAPSIRQAGLTAVPIGRRFGRNPAFAEQEEVLEEDNTGFPPPHDVVDHPEKIEWDYMRSGYATTIAWWKILNASAIHQLVGFAEQWRPDLVIWEPGYYAGPIAAQVTGAAHARLLWSVDVFGATREHFLRLKEQRPTGDRADPLADWITAYTTKYGVEFAEELVTGQYTIDPLPSSLGLATGLARLPLQYVPYNGQATVDPWLWDPPPAKPRVALSLGTSIISERAGGYIVDVQDLLDELGGLDIELVATIAEAEQKKLRRVPGNARLVAFAPMNHLVPSCAAVIHHAGIGTLATTSVRGVPQLSLPWDADQPHLARALAAQGGGLTVPAKEATGALVRENLLRLLEESSFRDSAAALREEMLTMPTPSRLVGTLEELVAGRG
ncbi:activator-dependent family glycosyltransferase [Amycolatopsis suaedae]|uniref:Activator-dependent family glycosyltransferase n=1 Tax=Amycolatopsis suaedae TaxID=2510978 RepID=A0A4Q7J4D7_9PSEU|nr:activator-dependent family glycosyltransferase [Amycolatopsis suaedae]RZQ61153.1 activator-dependent family glycosyltransferase [Amycolatopsis suaedae]